MDKDKDQEKRLEKMSTEISELGLVLYGDEKKGIKGMTHKVDEMYQILTGAKGIRSVLITISMVGAAVAGWNLLGSGISNWLHWKP